MCMKIVIWKAPRCLRGLLRRTDVPKLTLLPAGCRHKRSTELLASKAKNRG